MPINLRDKLSFLFNGGRGIGNEQLEGPVVKNFEIVGSSLSLTRQEADGSDTVQAFSPAVAAGSGNAVYVAAANYDSSANRIMLTIPTPPSAIEFGDFISFQMPANVDTATDDLDATVVGVPGANQLPLVDADFDEVKAIDLSAGRFYVIMRVTQGFIFWVPLHLQQVNPVQFRTVNITNAQIKELDQTYIELIPAPGAGRYLELLDIELITAGSDQSTQTFDDQSGTVDPADVATWGYNAIIYETDAGETTSKPLYRATPTEYIWINGHLLNSFYGYPGTSRWTVGGQGLLENKALMYGTIFNVASRITPHSWSADAYDQFIESCDDNTISITVRYYIHD